MMFSPQYEGFYGSVERAGKHSIQTLFYHFMGFPIWPQESYVVSGWAGLGGNLRVTEIKRHRGSIIAGYARGWTLMTAVILLFAAVLFFVVPQSVIPEIDPMPFGRSILAFVCAAGAIAATPVAIAAWLFTRGALSPDELAKRAIYQKFVGVPVDPAHLDKPWSQRDDIKRALSDVGERIGVRHGFDAWPDFVMRPELAHADVLEMALTLTRLCVASPEDARPDPRVLAPLHDAIWMRLKQVAPGIETRRP